MSTWTTEKPTSERANEKWWWFRGYGEIEPEIVQIVWVRDSLGHISYEAAYFTNGRREKLASLRGEWQPVEPVKE